MGDHNGDADSYTTDQVGDIIRRATEIRQQHDDQLTYDDLINVAREVGIEETAVAEALKQARDEQAAQAQSADSAVGWRNAADRCLELLCLKPITQHNRTQLR